MSEPNPYTFIVYVRDAQASAKFYGDLLDTTPVFDSPRFIAFELSPGVQLAVWSGSDVYGSTLPSESALPRTSELCLSLGSAAEIDARFVDWRDRGVQMVKEPYDDVFGRTFVAADPDGNLIRVAPVD
ncbi:VOC family protein [Corynebacterium sp. AOP36-E1-14]|uniref:VOC family protein n=1 Tax=unclassified Corynebacterium TaxID=2624378 RepID=UPI003F8DE419